MTDFLIVGQGITGTCLAHELDRRGASFHICASPEQYPGSQLAAAIINPVTGRNWVLSWNARQLIPLADQFYKDATERLGDTREYIHKRSILLVSDDQEIEENFMLRTGDPEYADFVAETSDGDHGLGSVASIYGQIQSALQLDMGEFVVDSRIFFRNRNLFFKSEIRTEDLKKTQDGWAFNDNEYRHVIFCDGIQGMHNPWFKQLPFVALKGQLLICEIPELETKHIIKGSVTVVPLDDPFIYWIGSTYERDLTDPSPTKEGRAELMDRLSATINTPFTMLNHRAGIRCATRDRRPFIGMHPVQEGIGLINGLGTKGGSLAPYCARTLVEHVLDQKPIPKEVDILRYWDR